MLKNSLYFLFIFLVKYNLYGQTFFLVLLKISLLDAKYITFTWVLSSQIYVYAQLLQVCLTLCNTIDCSPPGSSVHGISQAKILEWVVTPSSRGSTQLRERIHVSCISCLAGRFFTAEPLEKPISQIYKEKLLKYKKKYRINLLQVPFRVLGPKGSQNFNLLFRTNMFTFKIWLKAQL